MFLSNFYFPVRRGDQLFRLRDDLRRGCSSARWERRTGERSGNWATMRTSPPMALTVFRSVESSRSLRFSSRETLSWVIPRVLATRVCVSLRAFRRSRKLISSAMSSAARSSTFFRSARLSFRIISFTFTGMAISPFQSGQDARQNARLPSVSVHGRSAFRSHPICRPRQVKSPYAWDQRRRPLAIRHLPR